MSWGGQSQQPYGGYGSGQAGYSQGFQQPGPSSSTFGQPGYGQPAQQGLRPPGQYTQQSQYVPQNPQGVSGQYGGVPGQHMAPQGVPGQYGAHGQYGVPQGYGGQPPPYSQLPQYNSGFQQYGQAGYGSQGGFGLAPAPPPGISQDLWNWFQSVDFDKNGKITADELRQALLNGNWSPFNPETCRLMIGMFDRDRNGTIDVNEFAALWKYIHDWKACFDRFDTDRSGNIDCRELSTAFQTFGYNLSPQFSDLIIHTFDRRGAKNIQFDDFIQVCVMLKTLTDKFRAKDLQQNGTIRISYEEFLQMVLDTTLIHGAT